VSNAFPLVHDILNALDEVRVLKNIMLIGSWCLPVYRTYFDDSPMIPGLRTTDIDLFIPDPLRFQGEVDVPKLLESLGLTEHFDAVEDVVKYLHPDLEVEFLISEVGPPKQKKPYIPALKLIPQRLRFLNILQTYPLNTEFESIPVVIPEPAAFVIQKLLISERRKKKEKKEKDLNTAFDLGVFLLSREDQRNMLSKVINDLIPAWRKKLFKILRRDVPELYDTFNNLIV